MPITFLVCLIAMALLHFGCSSAAPFNIHSKNNNVRSAESANTGQNELVAAPNETNYNNKRGSPTSITDPSDKEFMGCWSGMKGGLREFNQGSILYTTQGRSYSFKFENVRKRTDVESGGYLINVTGSQLVFLNKVVWIRVTENKELILHSYKSFDDLASNKFVGAGEFVQDNCER